MNTAPLPDSVPHPLPAVRDAVQQLLRQIPGVWLGRGATAAPVLPTGHARLDALLPNGGWPLGLLIELVPLAEGIGELRLLMPALRHAARGGRQIVLVNPPYIPYAPALAQLGLPLQRISWITPREEDDALWAAEQALRAGSAGAVLLWTRTERSPALRRLQLAAGEGQALAYAYRPYPSLRLSSPAALRLALHPAPRALRIEIIKSRGGRTGAAALCPLSAAT